jgi:hypothetical protein
MLAADRQAVESDLQAQSVRIKEIEMSNIDRYLQAIGTQAALVSGFALGSNVIGIMLENGAHPLMQGAFFTFNNLSLVCEMYCVMNSTLVSVLGPTVALTGKKGSMHESVRAMKEERLKILNAFVWGAKFFAFSQILGIWILTTWPTALPMTLLLAAGCEVIRRTMNRIKEKFNYDEIFSDDFDEEDGSTRTQSQRDAEVEGRSQGRRKSTVMGLFTGASSGRNINRKPAAGMKKTNESKPMKADEFLKASNIV